MELIDTHAHYDDPVYDADREACLAQTQQNGVAAIVNAATDLAGTYRGAELARSHDFIFCTAGIHPQEAGKVTESDYEALYSLCAPENRAALRIVAVGETGLDYHYDFTPPQKQKENFAENIRLAKQSGLPLIVHDREAHEDTLRMLLDLHAFTVPVVFHCYSASAEFAARLVSLGCFFSFGGALTFRNARKFPEVLAAIPRDRLMLETDCPYMTPEPHRGTRNTSTYLPLIAAQMAAFLHAETEEIAALTTANARRFFGI